MKRSLLALTVVLTLGLSACSTESEMAERARAERLAELEASGPAEPAEEPEAEPAQPRVERIMEAVQARLARHEARRGALPADLLSHIGVELGPTDVHVATWDARNYNLCLVDRRTKEAALLQTELSPAIHAAPSPELCSTVEATLAGDVFESVDKSLDSILAPAGRNLAFGRGEFQARLARALASPRFGQAQAISTTSDAGPLVFERAAQGFEAVDSRFGPTGLAYACVTINGFSKMKFEHYSDGSFLTSSIFVGPRACTRPRVRAAALAWWDDSKL